MLIPKIAFIFQGKDFEERRQKDNGKRVLLRFSTQRPEDSAEGNARIISVLTSLLDSVSARPTITSCDSRRFYKE